MRVFKLISMPLALAALLSAALIIPTPALASTSATMNLGSELFPAGAVAPDGLSSTVSVVGGSSETLTAPQYLYEPPSMPGASPMGYEFMFWDINTALYKHITATFTAPSGGTFSATAWYEPICLDGFPCGSGAPAVSTWAFSLTDDAVIPGATPISSVSPSTALTGFNTVSTATNVTITAFEDLGPYVKKVPKYAFSSWFAFGATGATTSGADGSVLAVPAGQSPYAIAYYTDVVQPPIGCPPLCV